MRSRPSGALLTALQRLRVSSYFVTQLADSILLGGLSDRRNARGKIEDALRTLIIRAQAALEALETEGDVT